MSHAWNLFHKSEDSEQFDRVSTAAEDDDSLQSNSSVKTLDGDHNPLPSVSEEEDKQLKEGIKAQMISADISSKKLKTCPAIQSTQQDPNPNKLVKENIGNSPTSSCDSLIFERSVQDQGTILSSLSRRNSTMTITSPQLSHHHRGSFNSTSIPNLQLHQIQRTQSTPSKSHMHHHHKGSICPNCLNASSFPDHLNSEAFIPCVLDASTEILHDKNTNLENVEVIQAVDSSFFHSYLDPMNKSNTISSPSSFSALPNSCYTLNSNHYHSSSISRKERMISPIDETSMTPDVDYSNHLNKNQLNFCSFNDLVNDELEQQQQQQQQSLDTTIYDELEEQDQIEEETEEDSQDPIPYLQQHPQHPGIPLKRRSSSILILPALFHQSSANTTVGNILRRPSSSAASVTYNIISGNEEECN